MTISLLVADDHEVVRSGLVNLLSDTNINIVAEATNGKEAIALTLEHNPNVVLMDIRMIDGDGLTCLLYTSPSPRDKRQSRMPSSA